MTLKKYFGFVGDEKCMFCNLNEYDVLYGPIYKSRQKYDRKYIVVHYFCLLMASRIEQNGRDNQGILGFFPSDIIKELVRGKSTKCSFCGKTGATIQCVSSGCQKVFHLPCGIQNGSVHQFFDMFKSFCHVHRPNQNLPKGVNRNFGSECIICCSEIDKLNRYHSLWPSCCKPQAFFHRKCIQRMADNAGYYFKCPLCNNRESFKIEMQKLGIYVPDQDASWELEPRAYQELNVRGSGCESESCKCPHGINHCRKNSPWQLELCKVCGGNGTHLGCTDRWNRKLGFHFNWFCEICKPVFLENRCSKTPERALQDELAAPSLTGSSQATCNDASHSNLSSPKATDETHQHSELCGESNIEKSGTVLSPSTSACMKSPDAKVANIIKEPESEDEIIMVISDDEESPSPSEKTAVELPVEKLESAASSTDEKTESATTDMSDDCQFVQEISGKRRNKEVVPVKKKFRTALWTPPLDGREMGLEHSNIRITKVMHQTPADGEATTMGSNVMRVEDEHLTSATDVSLLDQPISEKLKGSGCESSPRKLDTPSVSDTGASIHRPRNSLTLHSSTESIPDIKPQVKLNLSEISIRLSSKPSRHKPEETPRSINVIDLSSDDESSPVQENRCNVTLPMAELTRPAVLPGYISKNVSDNGKMNSQLYQLLHKKGRRKMAGNTDGGPPSDKCLELFKGITNKYRTSISQKLAKTNAVSVVYQVLSSDDEDTDLIPSQAPAQSKTQLKADLSSVKIACPSSDLEGRVQPSRRDIGQSRDNVVENTSLSNSSTIHKNPSSESDQVERAGPVVKSSHPSLTVLPSALNVSDRITIKPDVFIVSDDDDDDDDGGGLIKKVQSNGLTSERDVVEDSKEESVVEESSSYSPILQNTDNSFGIVINQVISLANAPLDIMGDSYLDVDDDFVTIERIQLGSSRTDETLTSETSTSKTSSELSFKSMSKVKSGMKSDYEITDNVKCGEDSRGSFSSDQVVSSTVPLCSCTISCSCNIINDKFITDKPVSDPAERPFISADEEPVTSTTDCSRIANGTSSSPPTE